MIQGRLASPEMETAAKCDVPVEHLKHHGDMAGISQEKLSRRKEKR